MKLRSFIATQDGNVLVHDHDLGIVISAPSYQEAERELERRRVAKPARVWTPLTAPHERAWVA